MVYIGQSRRGQVPVTVASTWQGSWGRGLVRAAVDGACTIGQECWRRLEGPKIKNQKSHPMIAWETMDARKRAELLLPCVCAGAGAKNLKAAIELGRAGSDNKDLAAINQYARTRMASEASKKKNPPSIAQVGNDAIGTALDSQLGYVRVR